MNAREFWDEIERTSGTWSIEGHPFVALVHEGKATRAQLERFAVEHYHMTVKDSGPYIAQGYLSMGALDRDGALRMAENFAEEALGLVTGTTGHDELLFEFWEKGLGRARAELEQSLPSLPTRAANAYFWLIVSRKPRYIGALGLGEGGFSRACEKMYAGLRDHYGMSDAQLRFFSGHIEADREHAETGRELVERLLLTDEHRREFLHEAATMAELYWRGWDPMLE